LPRSKAPSDRILAKIVSTAKSIAQTLRLNFAKQGKLLPRAREAREAMAKKKTKAAKHKKAAKDKKKRVAAKARAKRSGKGKKAAKKVKPSAKTKAKAHVKSKVKPPAKPAASAKAKPEPKAKSAAPDKVEGARPTSSRPTGRKSSRRPSLLRRGPDGEILAPGDLLLPGGAQRVEEVLYLFRGCTAAEHPVGEEAVAEVLSKRTSSEAGSDREDLARTLAWARERFGQGNIEPAIPARPNLRRTFQGVVERAKQRRREIGAFLRGLDLGHTETSHMDAHGEASLTSLMKLAAGLENLAEAEEPAQTDANELHRVFEQLEAATETLIIDVEQTLRRLRDRVRA
jgi:hypothetical protein